MRFPIVFVCLLLGSPLWAASDFFQIKDVRPLYKPGKNGAGVWVAPDPAKPDAVVFTPCLELKLTTAQAIRSDRVSIRVYFFDAKGTRIYSSRAPSPARRDGAKRDVYGAPVLFPKDSAETVYFTIPQSIRDQKWTVVAVFGDKSEMTAVRYPDGSLIGLDFAERELALSPKKQVDRKPALDPVIEEVVKTNNPSHPQITLFLRPPNNVTDASEIKGVLAMCVLANSVDEIHRDLQSRNPGDFGGLLQFADSHKLAILCWGARVLWRPNASYDELSRETNQELDRSFDDVADAWERGVVQLHDEYGIPKDNYLLWGVCASAQWAHRLALRKPQFFLAAYIHIPSSFDRPTPDGAKILWLLTTGELDGGYQRAVRWYHDCEAAGYPMIYKAIINLGHAGSPIADNLGMRFFEYALSVQDQRRAVDEKWSAFKKEQAALPTPAPWLASFQKPEYIGDYLNQEAFPASRQEAVPKNLRVPLPTKIIADAWNQ